MLTHPSYEIDHVDQSPPTLGLDLLPVSANQDSLIFIEEILEVRDFREAAGRPDAPVELEAWGWGPEEGFRPGWGWDVGRRGGGHACLMVMEITVRWPHGGG